ncbi:hypothetical protein DFH07DRAFT_768874 [Mycena maculata]|uniref:Uncharacterized protein n=1 Tax=Mycena maculata TaxID=230809 RepID=A0AAD7JS73_9AGAR|nr:hypothetical protein DFH07DRAFT_768874 [Mycena maculata]
METDGGLVLVSRRGLQVRVLVDKINSSSAPKQADEVDGRRPQIGDHTSSKARIAVGLGGFRSGVGAIGGQTLSWKLHVQARVLATRQIRQAHQSRLTKLTGTDRTTPRQEHARVLVDTTNSSSPPKQADEVDGRRPQIGDHTSSRARIAVRLGGFRIGTYRSEGLVSKQPSNIVSISCQKGIGSTAISALVLEKSVSGVLTWFSLHRRVIISTTNVFAQRGKSYSESTLNANPFTALHLTRRPRAPQLVHAEYDSSKAYWTLLPRLPLQVSPTSAVAVFFVAVQFVIKPSRKSFSEEAIISQTAIIILPFPGIYVVISNRMGDPLRTDKCTRHEREANFTYHLVLNVIGTW